LSDPCSATTLAEQQQDTTAPTPVLWEVTPYETGGGQDTYANMTAQVATDASPPVEYYFECDGVPSLNSGWRTEADGGRVWNNVYIGNAHQQLGFRFRVRDSASPRNVSSWSTTEHTPP
jgi:hypothetical protein